jgi:hypothetical protein
MLPGTCLQGAVQWYVEDTSTNGTFVDGERVMRSYTARLLEGSRLRLSSPPQEILEWVPFGGWRGPIGGAGGWRRLGRGPPRGAEEWRPRGSGTRKMRIPRGRGRLIAATDLTSFTGSRALQTDLHMRAT